MPFAAMSWGAGSSWKIRTDRKRAEELVEAGEPVRRPLLDHLQDQVVEFRGDALVVHGQRDRPFSQVLVQQLLRGIGPERRAAAGQFIAGDPEAVNIGRRATADSQRICSGDDVARASPARGTLPPKSLRRPETGRMASA